MANHAYSNKSIVYELWFDKNMQALFWNRNFDDIYNIENQAVSLSRLIK